MYHLSDRAVLSVAGLDARDFLQGLITQNVSQVVADDGVGAAFAALLTPQGKILFDFFLIGDGDRFLVDVNAAAAADLLKRLKLYRLRARVDLAEEPDLAVGWGGARRPGAYVDPRLDDFGVRAVAPFKDLGDGLTEGFAGDGVAAYEERRLALATPEAGRDFGPDEVFLTDVNYDALGAVDYRKGCFVGQEVTSRMKRKSDLRKRSLSLSFDGPAPARGAVVTAPLPDGGEETLGAVTSSGEGRGIALIRLDRLRRAEERGARPKIDGRPAHVTLPDYLEAV